MSKEQLTSADSVASHESEQEIETDKEHITEAEPERNISEI